MAACDHTIICFHNGKLMRTLYREEGNSFKSLVPFKYNRDALPGDIVFNEIKQVPVFCSMNRFLDWFGNRFLKCLPHNQAGYFYEDDIQLISWQTENFNAIFYVNGGESYVMLGGYGHYCNPYTHFYHRGFGESFEREIAEECYRWLLEKVLPEALEWLPAFKGAEQENGYLGLWEKFRFKNFWRMTSEEQESYLSKPLMEYDE